VKISPVAVILPANAQMNMATFIAHVEPSSLKTADFLSAIAVCVIQAMMITLTTKNNFVRMVRMIAKQQTKR